MNRPELKSLPENIVKYISELEQKLADYEQEGSLGMYHALNRKANQLSREIDSIDLTTEDGVARFQKLTKVLKTVGDNLGRLKPKVQPQKETAPKEEEEEEQSTKSTNPVEQRAMNK